MDIFGKKIFGPEVGSYFDPPVEKIFYTQFLPGNILEYKPPGPLDSPDENEGRYDLGFLKFCRKIEKILKIKSGSKYRPTSTICKI